MTYSDNVNLETGEVLDDAPVERRPAYIPGVKMLTNTTNLARLELTGMEFQVLFAVAAHIEQNAGTLSHCTIGQIAEAMEKSHKGVERVFTSLRRKGILERLRPGTWAVNPRLIYRGSFHNWGIEYPQSHEPSYRTNSNGLDGKKLPREYNRTAPAPTGDAS